jgi:GT2 family glycosyltransferase
MHHFKVFLVLLNWNGKEDTLECLASVSKIDYPNLHVIVVDNGSRDDSVAAIQGAFPEVTILETGRNLGFAGGNNVGIRYALANGAQYILVLNNDTIVDAQLIRNFLEVSAIDEQAGIFGAKVYYYSQPNRIWYAGGRWLNKISAFIHVGLNEVDDENVFSSVTETDYACGCAFFVKADVLRQVGMFDEKFFLMFEETDFCYRARRGGFRCLFVPNAKVWHKVSVSLGGEGSGTYWYFSIRNRLLWAEKNLPLLERLMVYRRILSELSRCIRPPRFHLSRAVEDSFFRRMCNSVMEYKQLLVGKCESPANKGKLLGARDYLLRRFGDCPISVRSLGKESVK